jgi:4-hydroxy-2-oxoheptanedioate aldolase
MSRRLKEKLAADEPVLFVNPNHVAPSLVEKIGGLGFDGVFIDCERGSPSFRDVEDLARAARVGGIASIVRPDTNLPWLLTRYLDRGIDGIIVPFVHTPQDAQRVVDTVRYARPTDHEDKLVVVIIESRAAVENLPEILEIDRIDVFFIGGGDLAQDMGYDLHLLAEGDERPKDVQDAIDGAIDAILGADRTAGLLVNRANVGAYVDRGVRFFYEMADNLLATGARDFLDQAHRS